MSTHPSMNVETKPLFSLEEETTPLSTQTQKPKKPRKTKTPTIPKASPSLPHTKNTIVIYTDGACSGNPGPAGIGVVMRCGEHQKVVSEYIGVATNNIAELMAIQRALELIKSPQRPILLHTDSAYAIGILTKEWKAKSNQDLVSQIRQQMAQFPKLTLVKVTGHSGVPDNELADQLAVASLNK